MLAETMIPETFEKAQDFVGLITAAGFMTVFLLFKQTGWTSLPYSFGNETS